MLGQQLGDTSSQRQKTHSTVGAELKDYSLITFPVHSAQFEQRTLRGSPASKEKFVQY